MFKTKSLFKRMHERITFSESIPMRLDMERATGTKYLSHMLLVAINATASRLLNIDKSVIKEKSSHADDDTIITIRPAFIKIGDISESAEIATKKAASRRPAKTEPPKINKAAICHGV